MLNKLLDTVDRVAQQAGAFGRMRYVDPVSYREATGEVKRVYDEVTAGYGLGGPFFIASVHAPLLAGTWAWLREAMVCGPLSRGEAELISAAVAQAESCPFCVDVHSALASADGQKATSTLVAAGDWAAMAERDQESDRLALWARDFVRGSGAAPPVAVESQPHAIAVALLFVHITTLVTIFQEEGIIAGLGGLGSVDTVAKLYMRTLLGRRMADRTLVSAGAAEARRLDPDYGFARDQPALADAIVRFDEATAACELLSETARTLIDETVPELVLGPPTLDLRTLDAALERTPSSEEGLVRLVLLAAKAPYRILDDDLDAAGHGGARGERWVRAVAYGVRARLHTLARQLPSPAA